MGNIYKEERILKSVNNHICPKNAHMKLDKREKIKMVQGSIMQHVITCLQFNRLSYADTFQNLYK